MTRAHHSTRPGFTLVETLISMVVVSLIALGVAAILQAAAYGTSSQREIRRTVVRGEQVYARIEDAVRNARAVLAAGNGYIILWTGDPNSDGKVNRSEMQLIELPSGSDSVTSYTDAGSQTYSSNFYAAALTLKTQSVPPWASHISNLNFTLDKPDPMLARLVTWSLTLTDQQASRVIVGGAALRAPAQPEQ